MVRQLSVRGSNAAPSLSVPLPFSPPHTIISVPVHTAVCPDRPEIGASANAPHVPGSRFCRPVPMRAESSFAITRTVTASNAATHAMAMPPTISFRRSATRVRIGSFEARSMASSAETEVADASIASPTPRSASPRL
jgi:hypothetical protein